MQGHRFSIETDGTVEGTKITLDGVEIAGRIDELNFTFEALRTPTLRFRAVAPQHNEPGVPLPDLIREKGRIERLPNGKLDVEFHGTSR